jgi:ubiquinone/menaquinone biosynthesis C-methylase UbiE
MTERAATTDPAIAKWNKAARCLDLAKRGEEARYGVFKRHLFGKAKGKTLLVAAGTGVDFKYFPPDIELTAIDFSPVMLEHAQKKVDECRAPITLIEADVSDLDFPDGHFDTVVTSCTFCSVPDPIQGLKEVRRVLKDDGVLLMFEHVRPSNFYLGFVMDVMNPVVRKMGPEINRRTADNLRAAGFRLTREYNVYLDLVKLFEAVKAPDAAVAS